MLFFINKSNFYENKRLFKIDDIDVNKINEILVSKAEPYGKKFHLNTLWDIMMMITLDHYA